MGSIRKEIHVEFASQICLVKLRVFVSFISPPLAAALVFLQCYPTLWYKYLVSSFLLDVSLHSLKMMFIQVVGIAAVVVKRFQIFVSPILQRWSHSKWLFSNWHKNAKFRWQWLGYVCWDLMETRSLRSLGISGLKMVDIPSLSAWNLLCVSELENTRNT